jgi:hypothetical protein
MMGIPKQGSAAGARGARKVNESRTRRAGAARRMSQAGQKRIAATPVFHKVERRRVDRRI